MHFEVGLDEGGPGHLLGVLGVVHQAMFDHDPADGLPGDLLCVARAGTLHEFAVDVTVAPVWVFGLHPAALLPNLVGLLGLRAAFAGAIVLAGHEHAVPLSTSPG